MASIKLKDGKRVRYQARKYGGIGTITGTYTARNNSVWVVLHDKVRNAAVTVRPSQLSSI